TAPPDSFMTSEHNPVGPILGSDGLIMLSGSDHLSMRKEFAPFLSKGNLVPFAEVIENVFIDLREEFEKKERFNVHEFSFKATLKIILKFLFPNLSKNDLAHAEKLTEDFLKSYSASYLFLPNWVPGTWNVFNQKKFELDQCFYDFFIAGNSEGPLGKLSSRKKSEVLDHIRTFIVAGHETSATSLSWALYYIHSDDSLKNRLKEELSILENGKSFTDTILDNKLLDAIIMESLRIDPPVPFITRKIINRNFSLGGREFKVNEEIGVCITLLHEQKDIWKNHQSFDPQRFLDKKFSPHEFAPFGGGIRRCIGADLAILEMKVLVGNFIKFFDCDVRVKVKPKSVVNQITIGPKSIEFTQKKKITRRGENELPQSMENESAKASLF
ncbi:MAG: cytochrome P450, partial [Bacteriovorax sp.]